MSAEPAERYRFGTSGGGLWLGLDGLRLAVLGAGLLVTVLAGYAGLPLPLAVLPMVLAAAAVFWQVAGRPAIAWVGPAAAHLAGRAAGVSEWRAPLSSREATGGPAVRLRGPAIYGRLMLHDARAAGSELGILDDAAGRALLAIFAVAGPDRFALAEPTEQARLIGVWGQALAALSGDAAVRRLQWIETACPASPRPAERWMADQPGATGRAGHADYAVLLGDVSAQASRRQVHLAVALDRPRHTDGSQLAAAAEQCRRLAGQLASAELVARPLAAAEIGWLLRSYVDPVEPIPDTLPAGGQIGPASARARWDHWRTDDLFHRSFAITSFPRSQVGPAWLAPMLLAAPPDTIRHLAIHIRPVPMARALRAARSARAKAALDGADRSRLGFAASAATDKNVDDTAGDEAELVAGYDAHRLTGVVTASAGSLAVLAEAGQALRTAAAGSGLDLRPLHGQHPAGLLAALPLCRLRAGG